MKRCARCKRKKRENEFSKNQRWCKRCYQNYKIDRFGAMRFPRLFTKPLPDGKKRCRKCNRIKRIESFGRDKSRPDGVFSYCKGCRLKDPAKRKKINSYKSRGLHHCSDCKRWMPKEKFYTNASNKSNTTTQCRICCDIRKQNYLSRHPEYQSNYDKEYYRNNLEASKAKSRKWYIDTRPIRIAYVVKYFRTNKGKAVRARYNHKRRVQNSSVPATLTETEWADIISSQNNKCTYCKRKFTKTRPPTRDHKAPLSRGGGLTKENVQALDKSCNSKKHDKTHEEFLEYMRSHPIEFRYAKTIP